MKLNISISQFAPSLDTLSSNIEFIEGQINSINSEIIIFPELATSGYYYTDKEELSKFALEKDSKYLTHFEELAKKLGKIIIIGFPELDGELLYNSAGIFFPNSELNRIYRKTHLFYKEKFIFEAGNSGFFNIYYPEFDLNLGTMICYDWRFPEAARTLALKGSDLIVCPSNLVTGVWDNVMSARALENKVYVAVANRIGTEKRGEDELVFNGNSAIYGYNGGRLVQAGASGEEVISTSIEPVGTRDKSFNPYNDIFKDRREGFYY